MNKKIKESKKTNKKWEEWKYEQEAKGQVHWENTRENMDEEEREWLAMHGFPGERGWEI